MRHAYRANLLGSDDPAIPGIWIFADIFCRSAAQTMEDVSFLSHDRLFIALSWCRSELGPICTIRREEILASGLHLHHLLRFCPAGCHIRWLDQGTGRFFFFQNFQYYSGQNSHRAFPGCPLLGRERDIANRDNVILGFVPFSCFVRSVRGSWRHSE